eukprot:GHVT01020229.1.p1 GENE.GHVT01020229.1~~GHVT01020229.1.p1  ORF type:complete len:141 (-),score=7.46 GHVT01020229.1:48-470(-)
MVLNAREEKSLLHLIAYDIKKAFDTKPPSYAAQALVARMGSRAGRLLRLAADLATAERTAHIKNRQFRVHSGVPQGGIFSLLLFILAMEELASHLDKQRYSFPGQPSLGCLLYADDILLINVDREAQQAKIEVICRWCNA